MIRILVLVCAVSTVRAATVVSISSDPEAEPNQRKEGNYKCCVCLTRKLRDEGGNCMLLFNLSECLFLNDRNYC